MSIELDVQVRPSEDITGEKAAAKGSDNVTLETKHDSEPNLMETMLLYNYWDQTDSSSTGRPSEDGYNWSYYKCTHPCCMTNKKFEHSRDGQISEIIYRGRNNHLKQQTTNEMSDDLARYEDPIQTSSKSSMPIVTEESQPTAWPTERCYDGDGDTQRSMSLHDEGEDDETESTRWIVGGLKRKKDTVLIKTNLACLAVREPKVVIQIESEVDVLDDGYHWKKYGQKVVKGNPNPRSYYKCTNPGCPVRKHVERASNDLRSVITTYEGRHNHKVPTERTNNQICSCRSYGFNPLSATNFFESRLQTFPRYHGFFSHLHAASCPRYATPLPPPKPMEFSCEQFISHV